MRLSLLAFPIACWAIGLSPQSHGQQSTAPGHFLFAWTGDLDHKGNDFLAVIDADPASPSYGKLISNRRQRSADHADSSH